MFRDLNKFYKHIKNKKVQTVCLTATADDDRLKGSEHQALELLDFHVWRNRAHDKLNNPEVYEYGKYDTVDKICKRIEEER